MNLPSTLRYLCHGSLAVLLAAQSASAANGYWNSDANGNWASAADPPWLGAEVPGANSGTLNFDLATFGFALTADRIVTVDANRNIGGITFANPSSSKFTLSGGSLLLSNGGVIQTAVDNGDHTDTISTAIAIQGDGGGATFTAGANWTTSIMSLGAVTGASTGANVTTLVLNGGNVGDNVITGVLGNGTGGGKLAVTKSGIGTWILAGSNTFGGQLSVEEGILKVATVNGASAAGVFGNSTLAVILGRAGGITGTLQYTGASTSSSKKFTMAAGGSGAFLVDTTGAILTVSGVIDGEGILAKAGTGTLNLSGANTYTGGIELYDGVLALGSSGALGNGGMLTFRGGTLQFSATNKADHSARFSTTANQAFNFDTNSQAVTLASGLTSAGGWLTKSGTGTLTLSGVNTYDFGTTVNAGTLALTGAGTLGASTGSLTVDGATTIVSLGSTNQTVGAVYLWNGAQITGTGILTGMSFDANNGTISAKLAGQDAILTKNNSGTLTLTGANTHGGTTVYEGTLTLSGAGTLGAPTCTLTANGSATIVSLGTTNQTVGAVNLWNGAQITGTGTLSASTAFNVDSGTISAKLAGPGTLIKGDTATVILNGINTYSGATLVSAGTLQVAKPSSLPGQTTPGLISVADGATLAVNVGSSGEFTATDISNLLTNATFAVNSILGVNTTAAFAMSSSLTGAIGLSKLGTGVLTLSGTGNTYSGGTRVLGGTLLLSGVGTLGESTGALTVDGATAILSMGATNQTVGAVTVLNGGQITGTGTLTGTTFNVESGTISVKLAGTGAMLTKSSIGMVTLTGANTYDGGTLVNDGTLTLSGSGKLGAATGALTVDGGSAILSLGTTLQTVSAVSLLNGGQVTGTGTLTGTSFNVESGTISVKLAGTGAVLTKNSLGTVLLTGANTYTGGTRVTAGTLQAATIASLPGQTTLGLITVADGASLVLNAGGTGEFASANITSLVTNASFAANTLLGIDTTTATGGAFACTSNLIGAFSLSKLGIGTLTLSGANNTYSGGTTVSGGTLALSGTGKLGASTGALKVDGFTTILSLGTTSQTVGAVSLLNGAQITGTGTLTGTSFNVEAGSISAKLAGTGSILTKTTDSTVTLTGANTYDGGTQLYGGVLALGSSGALGTSGTIQFGGGTLQFSASNKTDYSARFGTDLGQAYNFDTNGQTITLAANLTSVGGSLTKSGAGSLTLSGVNTYDGTTTINVGTLLVPQVASLPGQAGYSLITVADGTTLVINAGGAGEFADADITNLQTNAIFAASSTFCIDTTHGDFDYSGNLIQAHTLVKLGSNVLTLSGLNTYTGGTIIGTSNQANAGTLRLSGAGTLGTAGTVVVYGGTLDLNDTTQAITTLTLGAGAAGSTAAVTIGTGELRLGGNVDYRATNNPSGATISGAGGGRLSLLGDRTFTVGNSTAAVTDLTISANLQNGDATARKLIKDGTGTLLLTGTNTYTGVTTINAGTLQVLTAASLPVPASGVITVAAGATLAVNAGGPGEFSAADISALLAKATFVATSTLGLDTTNAVGGNLTYSSNLTGGIGLNKLGTGTLTLTGTGNTYSGITTISAGAIQVNGSLGSGGLVTVPTGSTLGIGTGATVARSVTVSGGLLNLAGTMGTGSTLTLSGGTVNTVGAAATVAIVALPVPGATPVFSAPVDQELTVTNKLTQALSNGSNTITAGTTPFKVSGSNLVTNLDKLFLRGGTTKIERLSGNFTAGLDVRAWQGSTGLLEGTMFDLPGSPSAVSPGGVGYATGAIHTDGGDWFTSAGSGVSSGTMPTGYVENFTVEYRGKLRIATAGSYTFSLTSDDGSALWIDPAITNPALADAKVNNNGSHGMQQVNSTALSLTAGDHDIIVRVYQGGGGAGLYVRWDPLGGTNFVDIPGANYFHGSQTPAAVSLPTTELAVTGTNTVNLAFASGKATLGNLSLAASTLTFQTSTSVSLNNLTATDTASIASGPSLSFRTGNVTVADTKSLTLTPAIINDTAPTVLNKLGTGTLTLSGISTYTGATTVGAGTVILNGTLGSTAITVNSGATLTEGELGTIGGSASLTVAGTVTLGGVNTHTGATMLNAGTLTVTNPAALQRSILTFNGGGLDTGALTNVPLGGITANVDITVNSVLTTLSGYATWSAAAAKTLNIDGTITRNPGAAINFGTTGTISGAALGTLLGTNTINPWAIAGGIDWALYDGSKIAAYTGYTAATGIATAPTLTSAASANSRIDNTTTNNVTLATTGTIDLNSLVVNGSTSRTIDVKNGTTPGILRLGTAGSLLMGGSTHTIGVSGTGGTLTAGGATDNTAGALTVMTSSDGTINSVIADNGTGKVSLTKFGPGTLTLNASNTYSGDTTINSGILSTLSGGGKDIIPNGLGKGDVFIGTTGTLALVAATETINGLNGTGTVYGDAAGAGRLTLGDGNASGTFAGVLRNGATGILHLTKTGSGTQTLTAANTYTGTTTVSAGTLALNFSVNNPTNVLANTTAVTLSGGTLSVKGKSTGTTIQTVGGLALSVGTVGISALSVDANGGGGTLLALGAINRAAGAHLRITLPAGTQSASNGITTTTANTSNGILGNYATIGSDWATKSGSNIIPLATYTNLAALGSTITSGATTNVRLNSAGTGANIALSAATTAISTLLQSSTTAATVDTLSKTLLTSGIMLGSDQAALTIGAAAGNGILTAATAGAELVLINNATGSNLTINAAIQNNASASSLTKLGPGTAVLAGTNIHTGTTAVNGGKLSIDATGTLNTTSGILIRAGEFNYNSATALSPSITFSGIGGTLSGTGIITPAIIVTPGNTLAPGNSVGSMGFGTGLTLNGIFAAQLGTPGATPAVGLSDRAVVTGNLTLTGGTLSLSDNAGATGQGAAGAGAYRLMTFTGTLTGTFASVTNPLASTLHESVVYNGTSNGTVDLNVYRLAAAGTHTPEPLNLGTFHVGATASTALSLTNTAANDGFSEKLSASIGATTGDVVASGSFNQLAAQATNNTSLLAGFSTATLGTKSGTATITLNSDGTGTSGYGTAGLGTQTVNVSGTVYSGLMAWSGASGGNWSTNANWNDSQAVGVHAAPGLDAGYAGVDTATFGNTSGSVTVNLDGAAPSLNALTFNSTGSYTLAMGSSTTGITLAGTTPGVTATGTHTISAPLALASNATITPTNAGDRLTLSGGISGSGKSLTKNGAGTLTLGGTNTYGDTIVNAGTLAISAGGSLASGNVTVSTAGSLAGTGTIGGSTTLQGIHAPGSNIAGIQTFSNSLAYAATSRLQWQLTGNVSTGRGTNFDGVDLTGGAFSIASGATLDLSFGGAVDFTNSFWNSDQAWTLVDLFSGTTGDGGTGVFTLGAITGGSYNSTLGTFTVARVADAASKNDVVLKWSAGGGTTSPYQTWINSFTSIPVADRDPQDDPDHDGTSNLAEFAFKGVPNDPSYKGLFFTQTKDNNADGAKELTFTCAVRRSTAAFTANSDHAQSAVIDGVTYTIEGSVTLTGTWNSPVSYLGKSDAAPLGSGLPSLAATAWEYRTFSAFNGLPAGRGFLRTKVTIDSGSSTSPFETWINSFASIPAADRDPADDPDHDGATNLAEFAFNGDPTKGGDKGRIYGLTADSNFDPDTAKELILTIAVRAGTPVFSAATSPTASVDGITYTIEGGTTLNGFTTKVNVVPTAVTTGLPPAGSGYEYRSFSLNGSNGLPATGFLRAKVTLP
ncbi:MAG: autotransporter-associated beta strand repeat-containing protein [Verrucomicrobia bacterium]|nr:autotransporter-associated beta strand repeat-containing protein [Verrucomicrobiota bacterium]